MNARQARWLSFLSEYDFEIKHIKGKEYKVADTLIHHVNLQFASSSYEYDPENPILNAKFFDREYQILKENTAKNEQNQVKTYLSLNLQGLLLHKSRMYIPNIAETNL